MTVYESITGYIESYKASINEFEKLDGVVCTELRGMVKGLETARGLLTEEAAKCETL